VTENLDKQFADLQQILANQKTLGKRFLWLLIVPFVLTALMLIALFFLTQRVTDVEALAKRIDIDRYLQLEGNYAWAVRGYEEIVKTHPTSEILARLGLLYFQADPKKNEKIAIATLERARLLDSNNWALFRSLGYIYTAIKEPKKAIEAGQKALALNNLDSGTYNNLAWTYATAEDNDLRDLQSAETYALKAIELKQNRQAEYFDTLAQVYVEKGDRDRAVQAFRRAIALGSGADRLNYQERLKKYFPDEKL